MINQLPSFPNSITDNYQVIQELGRGAFSTIYKVQSKIDNKIYCLKKINLKKTNDKTNEINILSQLSHPNLVKYITSIIEKDGIYIIMEFCEYGDLYSLLHSVRKKKVYVNEEIIWDIAYQSLLALEYLHSANIIHRDIKLLNIFMAKDKTIKIGDMGMSKLLSKKEMKMSRVGTPLYIAPELVKKEKYDYKADIWSLGCSLYHLAKTVPPFNDENLIRLGQAIVNEQPPSLPNCYTEKLFQFILKLMTKDKSKRPSATEALELIPDKIKVKYSEKTNNNNKKKTENNINNNSVVKENKKKKNSNKNEVNNENKSDNSIINSKNTNDNKNEKETVLSSGKTFYKWFKALPEKRRSLQSRKGTGGRNNLDEKSNGINNTTGNSNNTQHGFFDSKLFSSNLISKNLSGTQEGFFKRNDSHKNSNNPNLPESISLKDKLTDSKNLNMLYNHNDYGIMKEDININVLKLNQENKKNRVLTYTNDKNEEKKEELKNNILKDNKPIVIKSEDFSKNSNGFYDKKNNTNLIFPIIQNHREIQKEKNFRSKISMMNKNKLKQQAENSGFNFFRRTYNQMPNNKVLTIHDLK